MRRDTIYSKICSISVTNIRVKIWSKVNAKIKNKRLCWYIEKHYIWIHNAHTIVPSKRKIPCPRGLQKHLNLLVLLLGEALRHKIINYHAGQPALMVILFISKSARIWVIFRLAFKPASKICGFINFSDLVFN